ncbi:protocadherin gamma-A10-like [Physella acuta]|uniref:protocadherin gamma-A10-like n=1 Tax=Physella acuta TaxID=109671 RepID=UPI0027DDE5AE|nr:protocadherin gamma-A10-like [Physella acuta]
MGYSCHGLLTQQSAVLFVAAVLTLLSGTDAQSLKITLGPLKEEQKTGTFVGNIAGETAIAKQVSPAEFSTLRFEFLDPSNRGTHLFSINGRSGTLYTQTTIDREYICDDMVECQIKFDVTVNSDVTDFLRLVEVTINIMDINDNTPAFEKEEIVLDIPENNPEGLTKPLPSAIDRDMGENSVQHYTLLNPTELFSLNVERRLNSKFRVSLVVNGVLDREKMDRYTLLVAATDGGPQPMTGTLTVHINVTDVNDNTPVFTQQDYSYSVVETAGVGDVVGKVTATDKDYGKNSEIRYTMILAARDSRARELFTIDPFTGEITIKSPLQYDAGKTFEAVVEARDRGDNPRIAEAKLTLTIVNVGNNAPRLEIKLQKTLDEETVIISEGAKNSTFVGKLTATDNDPGASGEVVCRSAHPCFKTENFGDYYAIIMNGSLDREQADKIDVKLVCNDKGSPPKTSSITFKVVISDINDNPPSFSQTTYVVNITEENVIGKQILKLTADDPDAGINKVFTYSLFPKENTVFSIDRESGILKARTTFDHEVEKRLNVIVIATDEGQPALVSTATVVVNILDINDNYPEITTRELRVPEGGGTMKRIGKLDGSDKDSGLNSKLVFSMPPTDDVSGQTFRVDPDGTVFAIPELDREKRDRYTLHLEVRDRGVEPKKKSGIVTVIVEDVNDHAPVFHFPTQKNQTVSFLWSLPPNREITRVNATDEDLGENRTISYFIYSGNKGDLFAIEEQSGILYLQRRVKSSDDHVHRLMVAAHDRGVEHRESQAYLEVIIDLTNATFAALNDKAVEDKYILIAGIVAGATLLFSIVILVIIFIIRRGNNRRPSPPPEKHPDWQVVKTGIQEEGGKGEVEKVIAWRGSDIDMDMKEEEERGLGGSYTPDTQPDVTKTGNDGTFKKQLASGGSPWHDDGILHGQTIGIGLDPYRKQDFYTFCKVRSNPHDDGNSVTSGETTTSDSGRGGSEDDIPLPPIAECSPELNSNHSSPKHAVEYRPITTLPLNNLSRQPIKSDYRTMPSLTSFRGPDIKLYPVATSHPLHGETALTQTYPYNGDKVHPSSRPGPAYTSLTQVPSSKNSGTNRHVTFSTNQSRGQREEASTFGRRSPFGPGYENLLPEVGGLYISLPRSVDDDDGNTTTSGSYTIDSDNLNDSITSA